MASVSRTKGPIHLGLDVHKDSISVAILHHEKDAPEVERVFHDEASIRRLLPGSGIRGTSGRATRRARPATSSTGSSPPSVCAARSSRPP